MAGPDAEVRTELETECSVASWSDFEFVGVESDVVVFVFVFVPVFEDEAAAEFLEREVAPEVEVPLVFPSRMLRFRFRGATLLPFAIKPSMTLGSEGSSLVRNSGNTQDNQNGRSLKKLSAGSPESSPDRENLYILPSICTPTTMASYRCYLDRIS